MHGFIVRSARLLLGVNVLVIGWISVAVATRWSVWTAGVDMQAEEVPSGPEQHLPLAGMGGVAYSSKEACMRLNGFLMEMVRSLGGSMPVSPNEIGALMESEQCSVNDPDVRTVISSFREAYQEAGLAPLASFALLDLPPGAAFETPPGPPGPPGKRGAQGGPPPGEQPPQPQPHPEMFPVAGMPSYTGGPEQACATLGRLLEVMDRKLSEVGVEPPLDGPAKKGLLKGACSLEDPVLASTLGVYRTVFRGQGLRPLPPFEYFRDPTGPAGESPPPKRESPSSPEQTSGDP